MGTLPIGASISISEGILLEGVVWGRNSLTCQRTSVPISLPPITLHRWLGQYTRGGSGGVMSPKPRRVDRRAITSVRPADRTRVLACQTLPKTNFTAHECRVTTESKLSHGTHAPCSWFLAYCELTCPTDRTVQCNVISFENSQ